MSYSEVTNLIEEKGLEAAFDKIYLDYAASKEVFKTVEERYLKAKANMEHDMYQAKMFLQAAVQRGVGESTNAGHYVRKIVGSEYVYFKLMPDGQGYSIGYETLTFAQ